jgi:8-oxoguanine deaminase
VVWAADPITQAGALTDPVEAWLRCGPGRAQETVVAGRVLVEGGRLTLTGVDEVLARHRAAAARLQGAAG